MLFPNAIRNKSQHKKKHPKKEATESRLSGSGKFIVFTLQSTHTQPGTSIILVLKKSGQIERHIPMPFTFFFRQRNNTIRCWGNAWNADEQTHDTHAPTVDKSLAEFHFFKIQNIYAFARSRGALLRPTNARLIKS